MDYLANLYKNRCTQLQEQINFLEKVLNEGRIAIDPKTGKPKIVNMNDMSEPNLSDAYNKFNTIPSKSRNPSNSTSSFLDVLSSTKPDKKPDPNYVPEFRPSVPAWLMDTKPIDLDKIGIWKTLSKNEEMRSSPKQDRPYYTSAYSSENTPAANRQRQITDDMFGRMMGTRDPNLQRDTSYVKPASAEDQYLADKFREHRNASLDRMIAGQKEITNIWDEAGKKIKQIYSNQQDPSNMTPEQKSDFMATGGDSSKRQEPLPITPVSNLLMPSLQAATAKMEGKPAEQPKPVAQPKPTTEPTQAQKDDEKFKQELQAKLAGIFQTIASTNK